MVTRVPVSPLIAGVLIGLALTANSLAADDPAQGVVWDLSPLFSNDQAWDYERVSAEAALPSIARLKGTLSADATALRRGLDQISEMTQRIERLTEYADLNAEADASSDANQARVQQMSTLQSQFEQATSFVASEILALGQERIAAFEGAEPGLAPYRRKIELILRRASHTLGPEEESLLASSGPLRRQPIAIHDTLMYSDIQWPVVEVAGVRATMGPAAYRASLFNRDREFRQKAFELVMKTLSHYQSTAGAIAFGFLQGTAFEAKARHYPTSLALALSDDAMPEADFQIMVDAAERASPAIGRYLQLRKRVLGLDDLHVYDLRVPLGPDAHRYRLDEAEGLILKALSPLGDDYVRALNKGFQSHAMHAILQPGKAPGALTEAAAYRVQPFVMLSFDGTFDSVSTIAHEWGHAMHAQLYQAAQPFENADITSTFLFDTPSLTNEILLSDYMIANARAREDKILALDRELDIPRYSYFATMSEVLYEVRAHEAVDRGEAVTGKDLNEMYCALLKHAVSADTGITKLDASACFGWASRPGIFYDFYFYKYLTAVSAAGFFVDALEKHDLDARRRYFELLKAGGSDETRSPQLTQSRLRATMIRVQRSKNREVRYAGNAAQREWEIGFGSRGRPRCAVALRTTRRSWVARPALRVRARSMRGLHSPCRRRCCALVRDAPVRGQR
jgi:oligoendopeptidase F